MEETRKRNEASMRRKHKANGQSNGSDESGGSSPTSTGAMDALLEKLRAAAPLARDQRDRRRRARLKDRYQVRIASGQNVPELPEFKGDIDGGALLTQDNRDEEPSGRSQESMTNGDDIADRAASLLQGLREAEGMINGEDVADRAASLLQGLRKSLRGDDKEESGSSGFNSIRLRKRIESANDERRARRSRRGLAGGSSSSDGRSGSLDDGSSPTIKKILLGNDEVIRENDSPEPVEEDVSGGSNEPTISSISTTELSPPRINDTLSTSAPTTVISPPSPG